MTLHLHLMLRLCIYGAVPSLPPFSIKATYLPNLKIVVFLSTVIPQLTKIIHSGITFVSRNLH